jgi:hypothetical protein
MARSVFIGRNGQLGTAGLKVIGILKHIYTLMTSLEGFIIKCMRNSYFKSMWVTALAFYYASSGGFQTSTHNGFNTNLNVPITIFLLVNLWTWKAASLPSLSGRKPFRYS